MHKSLQVLISGNLCLKAKRFSFSGPILVTAQPLSVIRNLLPCLTQRKHRKCKTPGANREDPKGSKARSSHQTRGRRDREESVTPAHRCVFEKQAEYILSAQTVGGWGERGGDLTKPYGLVKFYFQF